MNAELKKKIARLRRGEVLPGYKKTEIGVVPEEWECRRLGSVTIINPHKSIAGNDDDFKVSFLAMADISEDGKIIKQSVKAYKDVNRGGYTPFAENDVLIAKITPCFENGKGTIAKDLCNKMGFGSTEFHVVRAIKINPELLYQHTRRAHFRKNGKAYMTGSAGQQRVPEEYLRSYPIPLPPMHEQCNLVKILSIWDDLDGKLVRLLERKQKLRQGLLQTLLTGRKRFPAFDSGKTRQTALGTVPAEWEVKTIGEVVAAISREVAKPTEPYRALGIRCHAKGTFQRLVENPDDVAMDKLYEVKSNDLIVNITFAWEHAIAIAREEDDSMLVSHRFPTYVVNTAKMDLDFLRIVILQPRFRQALELISPGGAGRNRVLNKKDFLKIPILLPSIEEQREIGMLCASLNHEIELLTQERAQRTRQKQALMELLLTGKVRVPLRDAVS